MKCYYKKFAIQFLISAEIKALFAILKESSLSTFGSCDQTIRDNKMFTSHISIAQIKGSSKMGHSVHITITKWWWQEQVQLLLVSNVFIFLIKLL